MQPTLNKEPSKLLGWIDVPLLRYIVIIYSIAFVLDYISATLVRVYENTSEVPYYWYTNLGFYVINYASKFIFILFVVYVAQLLLRQKTNIYITILTHIILVCAMAFYTAAIMLLMQVYINNSAPAFTAESLWIRGLYGISFNFFVYGCILAIVYAYHYLKRQKEEAVKGERLNTQLLDAKINALQSQLQPHFLFNALNDISSMISINKEKAQDAIADLSDLLRSTLTLKDNRRIMVSEELHILKKYLDLEQLRFGEKLTFVQVIDPSVLDHFIPPLILQPFIENAIKHGYSYHYDHLQIDLSITYTEQMIHIIIRNNGVPLDNQEIQLGNGISNVLERLDTIYNQNYTFQLQNCDNEIGVEVRLILPSNEN